jgi:hypothetical protein
MRAAIIRAIITCQAQDAMRSALTSNLRNGDNV